MFKTLQREPTRRSPTARRRGAIRLQKRLAEVARERRRQARIDTLPPARQALVRRVRGQIAAGTYMTDEKLSIALDLAVREMAERAVTV